VVKERNLTRRIRLFHHPPLKICNFKFQINQFPMNTTTLTPQRIKQFQKKILDWYSQNKRDLPWRKTRDPYKILVSEIMLQQTQVSRVLPKYELWLQTFPTIQSLVKASIPEVLHIWSGLGYNRRALYLKKAAEEIIRVPRVSQGMFPLTIGELRKLPGVGEYTARAVACFAFGQQVAVVDTNVRKVILLTFFLRHPGKRSVSRISRTDSGQARMTMKKMQRIADQLLPYGQAAEWNQALMDYASATLKKQKIPIPKQSKFIGSNRYYRGKIIKLLLQKKKIPITELEKLFEKDSLFIKKIIDSLVKDKMVLVKKEIAMLCRNDNCDGICLFFVLYCNATWPRKEKIINHHISISTCLN